MTYLMTSLSHGTADWLSPVSVANLSNELTAQYSNTWHLYALARRLCGCVISMTVLRKERKLRVSLKITIYGDVVLNEMPYG